MPTTKPQTPSELLPCPFCGYEASISEVESAGGGRIIHIVGCNSEDCDVSFPGHARKIDAAKAWNTRPARDDGWTAVEDGLPKSGSTVLISYHIRNYNVGGVIQKRGVRQAYFLNGTWRESEYRMGARLNIGLAAWRPLPEPYKGDK